MESQNKNSFGESHSSVNVQLARHLGIFDATMIGVGAMIGAGIFVLTGIATGLAGPAAVIAFALNGVVTLFTALSYAELASLIPEAGGGYSYIKKVMPNSVAFASGWMLWFAYIVACSLYAKAFGSYFLEFFEREAPQLIHRFVGLLGHDFLVAILTLCIGLFFIIVNIIGTQASGQTENVITVAKLLVLGIFIFFGYRRVISEPTACFENFSPLFPNGFNGILAAMGLTFIAFEGYDLIATVSEEVKDPQRTIPRAIIYSLGITLVVYLSVVFVSVAALKPAEGMATWQLLGKYGETGIIHAAQGFMPSIGVFLILFGGLFATLSALNATILASSRVAFSMGRDWMLPNRLSVIHPLRKTPVVAITSTGLIFLAVAIFLPIKILGSSSSLLFLLTFSLVNLALIMYRFRSREKQAPFRVPLFPLTPILGLGTCLGLAIYQLWNEPVAWLLSVSWIGIGIVIYWIAFSKRVTIADVPKVIESPELLSLKKTRNYKILLPLANPEHVKSLVDISARIAKVSRGEVIALSVVDLPKITNYENAEELLSEPQTVLNKAQQLAFSQQVSFSSLLKIGRSAATEIVQVALDNRCNLILLGYKKAEDPLENSVIHYVISHQPCDVAILKSERDYVGTCKRLLIPIGGKTVNDSFKVRFVHSFSREANCEIALMTVIPPEATKLQQRRAKEALQNAAGMYNLHNARLIIEESNQVAKAIAAQARDDDLLILGMREEPWLQTFFFGTVAQQVAHQVHCPTLLIKALDAEKTGLKRILRVNKSVQK